MPYIVAVSGKGGTGKTTLAALILRTLLDSRRTPVFAVDADPNACLGLALNVPIGESIGDLREDVLEDPNRIPAGMSKTEYLQYRIRQCVQELPRLDLITMGRPEGPRCYCYVNSLLRQFLDHLDSKYRYVVIDNEAGMEHLSRRTTHDVDLLLLVSDPSLIGIRSAGRIKRLAEGLDVSVRRIGLVLNRSGGALTPEQESEIRSSGAELWGVIPEDPQLTAFSLAGRSVMDLPFDAPALAATRSLLARIWQPSMREAACVSSAS